MSWKFIGFSFWFGFSWSLWCGWVFKGYKKVIQALKPSLVAFCSNLHFGLISQITFMDNFGFFWFSLIWFVFLWCKRVCYWYISVLQTMAQAKVALVEDLQNWLKCMWGKNGIFSLFHFSLFDLIFLDSKVILIGLETFPNHWNHSKRSSSKICKNGHKHIRGDIQFFLILLFCFPCFTWAWVRVQLVWY